MVQVFGMLTGVGHCTPLNHHVKFAARFSAVLEILHDSTSFLSGVDVFVRFTIFYLNRHCTGMAEKAQKGHRKGRTHLHLALM